MARTFLSLALFAAVTFAVAGLVTGAPWLVRPTPGLPALPLGNLAIWVAMVATAVIVRLWAPAGPWILRANGLLVLALAWLPVSRLLAGDWQNNFEGGLAWAVWRAYTAGLGLALIGGLLAVLVMRITGQDMKPR
jgi:hypothetical protein